MPVHTEGSSESESYLAQDARGAIWSVDVSHSLNKKAPLKLLSCPAGKITGVAVCPVAHAAACISDDGSVRLVDYVHRQTLCVRTATSGARVILWLPLAVRFVVVIDVTVIVKVIFLLFVMNIICFLYQYLNHECVFSLGLLILFIVAARSENNATCISAKLY